MICVPYKSPLSSSLPNDAFENRLEESHTSISAGDEHGAQFNPVSVCMYLHSKMRSQGPGWCGERVMNMSRTDDEVALRYEFIYAG